MIKKVKMLLPLLQSISFLVILIVLLKILYERFYIKTNTKMLLDEITLLINNRNILVPSSNVNMSMQGFEYSLLFWLYVPSITENSNWRDEYSKEKGIISHTMSPNVMFQPKDNTLIFKIGYLNEKQALNTYDFEVKLPEQTWIHFGITVKDKVVNLYQNNEIIKSATLPFPPWFSERNLYIGEKDNNSMTYIANVQWANYQIDSLDVEHIYNKERRSLINKELPSYSDTLQELELDLQSTIF